jgi:ketosteroid isomerase-like protein
MNEETNTKIVQDAYAKFGAQDIPGLLELCAENIEWEVPEIENAPWAGKRNGLNAVGEFFSQLGESETFARFEPLEFVAQNDKVVVLGESDTTVNATGKSYQTEWVHVFHINDGKIAGFQEFFDNAAANRAFQKTATA